MPGGIIANFKGNLAGFAHWSNFYAGSEGIIFSHNLTNLITSFYLFTGQVNTIPTFAMPYTIFAFLFFSLTTIYIFLYEKDFWKKIALLVLTMDLLTNRGGDYKLLYLYIPLFLFINNPRREKFDILYAVLFALLLIQKPIIIFPHCQKLIFQSYKSLIDVGFDVSNYWRRFEKSLFPNITNAHCLA